MTKTTPNPDALAHCNFEVVPRPLSPEERSRRRQMQNISLRIRARAAYRRVTLPKISLLERPD